MDVTLRPPFRGCLIALLSLMTLGLYPLPRRFAGRRFIRRRDEAGTETRGGKRIAWGDFARIERVVGTVQGVKMPDEYLLYSSRGRVPLPMRRAASAEEALDYLRRRRPPGIKAGQAVPSTWQAGRAHRRRHLGPGRQATG